MRYLWICLQFQAASRDKSRPFKHDLSYFLPEPRPYSRNFFLDGLSPSRKSFAKCFFWHLFANFNVFTNLDHRF